LPAAPLKQGVGSIALVGSGEYLPVMLTLEGELLRAGFARGKKNSYVQLATAAGNEDEKSLNHWRDLGEAQARRLGAECIFVPVFNREDAFRAEYVELIANAGLIYFSGGDPHYLAETLRDTPLWKAVESEWISGSSLGGCSAGAMVFGSEIMSIRKSHTVPGLNLLPSYQVIPHYDRFLGWLPDRIASTIVGAKEGIYLLGIDEETALMRDGVNGEWHVWGERKVHVLKGMTPQSFAAEDRIQFI
jgi:cyanophycinase